MPVGRETRADCPDELNEISKTRLVTTSLQAEMMSCNVNRDARIPVMGERRHHVRESVEERREDGPDARQALSVALHRPEPLDVCSAVMAFLRSNLRHRPIRRANAGPDETLCHSESFDASSDGSDPCRSHHRLPWICALLCASPPSAKLKPLSDGARREARIPKVFPTGRWRSTTSTPRAKSLFATLFPSHSERRATLPSSSIYTSTLLTR